MIGSVVNGASTGLQPVLRLHARVVGLIAFSALLLATAGAFDTENLSPAPRLGYWMAVSLISVVALSSLHRCLRRHLEWTEVRLRCLGAALLLLPLTAVAMLGCKMLFGSNPSIAATFHLLPGMGMIVVALQILLVLFSPEVRADKAGHTPRTGVLAERLPLPLREAKVYALEAQDHYVRVHTSAGEALIRHRFSDAIAAVAEQNGLRPHRSWWVAKEAVSGLSREGGRATLVLVNGSEVPVSRAVARSLGPSFRSDRASSA